MSHDEAELLTQMASGVRDAMESGSFPLDDHGAQAFLRSRAGYDAVFSVLNAQHRRTGYEPYPDYLGEPYGPVFDIDTHFALAHQDAQRSFWELHTSAGNPLGRSALPWWVSPERHRFTFPDDGLAAEWQPWNEQRFGQPNYIDWVFNYSRAGNGSAQQPENYIQGAVLTTAATGANGQGVSGNNPTTVSEMRAAVEAINKSLEGKGDNQKLFYTGVVTLDGEIEPDPRDRSTDVNSVIAWKIYPPRCGWFRSTQPGRGWFDSPEGRKALTAINRSGHRNPVLLVHWRDDLHSPDNERYGLALAAEAFPKIKFVVLHAAYSDEPSWNHAAKLGALMRSHANVYAETGGVFDLLIARNEPARARDLYRDLLGSSVEESSKQIVWGSDSIWRGTPQWQFEALCRLDLRLSAFKGRNRKLQRKVKQRILWTNAVEGLFSEYFA